MKRIFIYLLAIVLSTGCSKQMERRFPVGDYKISILNATYIFNDEVYMLDDSTIRVKLVSSENDLIELTQYSVNSEFDTIFATSNSELYIEKKNNVIGTIKTSWNEPLLLYVGEIEEQSKNEFIISGKAQYHHFLKIGASTKLVFVKSDFIFEEQ